MITNKNTPVKKPVENIGSKTTNWTGSSSKSSIKNTPDTFEEREDVILNKTDNKVKKNCGKCGFRYLFDPDKNYPQNCPNCGGSGSSHIVSKHIRR